jgi:hypothetical protein
MMPRNMYTNMGLGLTGILAGLIIAIFLVGSGPELNAGLDNTTVSREIAPDPGQNEQSALDQIVYHASQAGYGLPPGIEAVHSANTNPDTVTFLYSMYPVCKGELLVGMENTAENLRLSDGSIGCFNPDTWAYIYDPTMEEGEFFLISTIDIESGIMQHDATALSKPYPAGSEVYLINKVSFYVDNTSDPAHPRLVYKHFDQPYICARDIQDLEITYTQVNGVVVDSLTSISSVKEMNIGLVASTEGIGPTDDIDDAKYTLSTSVHLGNKDF